MVVSKNLDDISEIRNFIEYDGKVDGKSHFNFQMGNLQAAIGREQLKKIPEFLSRREEIFNQYKDAGFDLIDSNDSSVKSVRFRALMKTDQPKNLIKKLISNEITSVMIYNDPIILKYPEKYPNSFELTENTISLPIYPSLTDEDVSKIISSIK